MSIAPKQLIAHAFADLPSLLAQAGRTDLLPPDEDKARATDDAQDRTPDDAPRSPEPAEPADLPLEQARGNGLVPVEPAHAGDSDLPALLAELERANATLARLLARDEQERRSALEGLERYDAAVEALVQAKHARARADAVLEQAQQVSESAFSPATRTAARQVLQTARTAAERADRLLANQERRVEALCARPEVKRALVERRRLEAAQQRADALATARTAVAAGWLDEARSALLPLATADPGDSDVAGLLDEIAREQLASRSSAALAALWAARRELRRDPAAAASRLASLELDGVARELVGQVFGTWLRACARLCRDRRAERPRRYAAGPGRGAVLVRESPSGAYIVLSALGMDEGWRAGRRVRECVARSARPLLP